jgi:hypothetical protein
LDRFGAIDGELMGAAFLEMTAGRTLRAELPSERNIDSTHADDSRP